MHQQILRTNIGFDVSPLLKLKQNGNCMGVSDGEEGAGESTKIQKS